MILLCDVNTITESTGKGFVVNNTPLLVVRKFGAIFVYRNECPHMGVSLEWQPDTFLDSTAELIQCATHGALFVIQSGECIAGPCYGEALCAIPSEVRDQQVWITLPST